MKVVILAGGMGSRLSEETSKKPKPLVEIGGKPILWHIMKHYSVYGLNEFIICAGYKGYLIKEFFANYFLHNFDVTFDLKDNDIQYHHKCNEPWKVSVVDTGLDTMTGGRLKRIKEYLDGDDFCLTYGDGVGDIDIAALVNKHKSENKLATVTAVQPAGRFGAIEHDGNSVLHFKEKVTEQGAWVNGGFFVLSNKVLDYIDNDQTSWELAPMEQLAQENQMAVHIHDGFWQPMDTLREKTLLDELWASGTPPWKTWE